MLHAVSLLVGFLLQIHCCVGRPQSHVLVAPTNVCMLISHVLGRGQIAAQHTADVQTAPGILRESQIFYHICSLQSPFPYQRAFFKRFVCSRPPTSPPVNRPWPHVRSPPPSRIVLLERRACSVCCSPSAGRVRPLIC